MNEKGIDPNTGQNEPEIVVNNYGTTKDSAVVIEEADRTVLLTENETIVIPKETMIDIAPKNRPRKVYRGMWGPAETATAGLALLTVIAVVLLYIFFVVPSNRELEKTKAERDRLEREVASAKAKYGDITSTETQVAKLISSVEDFEASHLPIAVTGKSALYQRINGLIAGYGLINTTGPDYAPLEIADQDQGNRSDEEKGRSKFQSLFPGVYVTTTVEGSYQNLRGFIRDIETGREFVVISAVELEPSDSEQKETEGTTAVQTNIAANPMGGNPNLPPGINVPGRQQITQQPAARPRGKTHGETVRLRLEMAAYFRRPNAAPPVVETEVPPAF
ncbi:MAG: hypothetical protein H7070_13140 [Saprospiraceae bacterium]|nr:hypothetical protein [Pyrinomonadaceae bacterium]